MIQLSKILINGSKASLNDQNILLDNYCFQEYQTQNKELIIDAEFLNANVENIKLQIQPCPEFDIKYKLFNINAIQVEGDIQEGKLIREKRANCAIMYTSNGHKQGPFTHLKLTIRSQKIVSYRVYFIGLKGKLVLEKPELLIQEEKLQQKVQFIKPSLIKPAVNNLQPMIGQNKNFSFKDFLSKVKSGQSIATQARPETLSQDKIKQEKQPDQRINYITLIIEEDDNENEESQARIDVKVQKRQFGLNKKPIENLFQNNDQKELIKISDNHNIINRQEESEGWIQFDMAEIDQKFAQCHNKLEKQKGLAKNQRLAHKMYNEL